MSSWVTVRHSLGPISCAEQRLHPLDPVDLDGCHRPRSLVEPVQSANVDQPHLEGRGSSSDPEPPRRARMRLT